MKPRVSLPAIPAVALALALASAGLARGATEAEPLPSSAPAQPYELAAWCYGAMSEYLDVYDRVRPDLRDIDKLFGSSVKNEKEPYASDIAAAREELTVLAGAVEGAEKASAQVISTRGAQAVKMGRAIWSPAEQKTRRELARAWLSWALPDRCDANARELAAKSALLGKVLKYNATSATDAAPADAAPPSPAPSPAPEAPPPRETPPPPSTPGQP